MKKFRYIFILFVVTLVGVSLTSCNDEDLVTDPYSKSGVNLLAYGPSPILRNTEIRLTGTNMQKVDKVIFPGNAIVERSVTSGWLPATILSFRLVRSCLKNPSR